MPSQRTKEKEEVRETVRRKRERGEREGRERE
jgi:hypothetical protein